MPRRTPRHGNLFTHLTAAVVVPGCIALCWWQVARALSGNSLSWAYVFEWPIFAGYGVFMWWKLIHDRPPGVRSDRQDPVSATEEDEEDEELASYNRYLAELHASGKRKHW